MEKIMDSTEKAIKEKIDSSTIEQAREFVATYHGSKGSRYHDFAEDCLATKEAALKDTRDSQSLTISAKALQASEEANKLASDANKLARDANSIALKARSDARWANIIAITAAVIAIAAIILQLLIKK
jgi:hypothetical protein